MCALICRRKKKHRFTLVAPKQGRDVFCASGQRRNERVAPQHHPPTPSIPTPPAQKNNVCASVECTAVHARSARNKRSGTTSFGVACSLCWATSTTSGRSSSTTSTRGSYRRPMTRRVQPTTAIKNGSNIIFASHGREAGGRQNDIESVFCIYTCFSVFACKSAFHGCKNVASCFCFVLIGLTSRFSSNPFPSPAVAAAFGPFHRLAIIVTLLNYCADDSHLELAEPHLHSRLDRTQPLRHVRRLPPQGEGGGEGRVERGAEMYVIHRREGGWYLEVNRELGFNQSSQSFFGRACLFENGVVRLTVRCGD